MNKQKVKVLLVGYSIISFNLLTSYKGETGVGKSTLLQMYLTNGQNYLKDYIMVWYHYYKFFDLF